MHHTLTGQNALSEFKQGVDSLLQKQSYFVEHILPTLVEGKDYYIIKGKKSLGKSGAEKLASIYQIIATFELDSKTMESFKDINGLVAYICTLTTKLGEVVGQGRGAAEVKNNGGDCNKTIKMAEKSAYISSVIRYTGLSDFFTSDLEDMPPASIQEDKVEIPESIPPKNLQTGDEPMTDKQRKLLHSLIFESVYDPSERERWLQEAESCSKFDASDLISSFMPSRR